MSLLLSAQRSAPVMTQSSPLANVVVDSVEFADVPDYHEESSRLVQLARRLNIGDGIIRHFLETPMAPVTEGPPEIGSTNLHLFDSYLKTVEQVVKISEDLTKTAQKIGISDEDIKTALQSKFFIAGSFKELPIIKGYNISMLEHIIETHNRVCYQV